MEIILYNIVHVLSVVELYTEKGLRRQVANSIISLYFTTINKSYKMKQELADARRKEKCNVHMALFRMDSYWDGVW